MSASTAPTSRITAASWGKMPTTRARRLISLLTRSSGLVDHTFAQCDRGKPVKASTSVFASFINERLADAGAVASIGTVGDSYDNAHAESLIGLYKLVCAARRTVALGRRPRAHHPQLGALKQGAPPPRRRGLRPAD